MKPNLRLIRNDDSELAIRQQKKKSSYYDFKMLVVQALCFGLMDEYTELVKIHSEYKKTNDVDLFALNLAKHKHLYELGIPSEIKLIRIKEFFTFLREENNVKYETEQENSVRNIITKAIVRAIIFEKFTDLNGLFSIARHFRINRNIQYVKASMAPYLYLLEKRGQNEIRQ